MIRSKLLRKFLPGIRAKLSFFTAILVVSILAITSFVNYNQQKSALEEKMNSELKAPLEYVNGAVLELENLSHSLILIEEFKIRVKEKKQQLSKFKRRVLRKEGGLFGALKSFGASIGLKVKYNYYQKSIDTYFTRYLSEKEIQEFETKVKGELRKENGAPIDSKLYQRMLSLAKETASAKIAAESANARIEEVDETIKELETSIYASETDFKKKNILISEKEKLSKEIKILQRDVPTLEKKSALGETALTKTLQNFFKGAYKDKIASLGLLPDKVRILAYDTSGKQTLDTGLLFPQSSGTGKKLLSLKEFEESRAGLFQNQDIFKAIQEYGEPENYEVGGRQYEVSYRSVFRNPGTAERSKILADEISENGNGWKEYFEEDKKFSLGLGELSQKLKTRLSELKKKGKVKPSSDLEFKNLYSQYRKILKSREDILEELNPYKKDRKKWEEDWNSEKKSLTNVSKSLNEELLFWRKKEVMPIKSDENKISTEEIQEKIRSLEAKAEEVREVLERLETGKGDWTETKIFQVPDTFSGLREAALDEFAFLPYRSDSNSMRRYWKDEEERKLTKKKWALLREWILSGNSETELPKSKLPILDSGILIRSRSEAEEWMWALDSTPLLSDIEGETKGLGYDLLLKNHLGYNIVLLDRTEGLRKIRRNREALLRYTSLIGCFAVLLAYLLAWVAAKRIKVIIDKTEEVGKGNLNVEFPPSGYDEIGILGESLNQMIHGLKEREEMKGELLAAEEIQKRLLPDRLPSNLGNAVEFGAFYKAMAGVGGDYYDFIELGRTEVALCVGDVSNHGVGPAIVMSLFRAQVRSILRKGERDLRKILLELNEYLYSDTPDHIFVTFFIAIYDQSSAKMRYISAGHVKPLLYDASEKKLRELPGGGLPIGMDENSFFETTIEPKAFQMDPGDIFFQYTDGLDEARNSKGVMYGKDRIFQMIIANANNAPTQVIQAIVDDLDSYTGKSIGSSGFSELSDDIAMISMKRKS
ncbi:SpoIIE family protein phosphatase [Leptospira sp. 201903071]|uniref:SpoIIE family protein phosphatase n=1 Tax=Leptospira ainazelensis TaxID=2810034 RepID=UPI0019636E85|nr:SpoIIE family protein phosphatase [Leptospira ainazelensis]MBM9500927.1 SpoIIE family protein phosphatase [Leptospira ainazelensis]